MHREDRGQALGCVLPFVVAPYHVKKSMPAANKVATRGSMVKGCGASSVSQLT